MKVRHNTGCEMKCNTDLHILVDRKFFLMQPGQEIWKIVDLYHKLTNLLNKVRRHQSIINVPSHERIEEMKQTNFVGMTKEEMEEEWKEYVTIFSRDWHLIVINFISCKWCHTAMKLLDKLILNFMQKVAAADNTSIYCALVSLTSGILHGFLPV